MRRQPPVRDRDTSIWQSRDRRYALLKERHYRALQSADPLSAAGTQYPPLQKRAAATAPLADARPAPPTAEKRPPASLADKTRHFWEIAKYSTLDWLGWAQCELEYLRYRIESRFPQYKAWNEQHPPDLSYGVIAYRLPSTCTILLIGDWGTHMADNVALARQALKKFTPDAVIHLGDIYYSGTREECTENVVDVMDMLVRELNIKRPPFFTLPGNHDYYSGGRGFYQMLGKINATLPDCEQKASYFCLRTQDDHWQFLGMDTGYNDRDPIDQKAPGLVPSEVTWHRDKLDNFGGTTVLLSHHQLMSAKEVLSKDGPRPWLNEGLHLVFQPYYDRVAAWFWGHEHNLIFFKDNQLFPGDTKALRKGRLLGCSAYEETLAEDPYSVNPACAGAAFMDNMQKLQLSKYRTALQTFYDHAFALLEVSPQKITVSYYAYPSWDQDFDMPADPAIGAPLFVEDLPLIRR